MQVVSGIVISLFAIRVIIQFHPYNEEIDNHIAEICQWAITITLFSALLIRARIQVMSLLLLLMK